jgi:hypothetical protein
MSQKLKQNHFMFVILLIGFLSQSCSDQLGISPTAPPLQATLPQGPVAINAVAAEETYISDPQQVFNVLIGNTYYIFFNDNFGAQQIAAIKFGQIFSRLGFPLTWTELSGTYEGLAKIENDGRVSLSISFGQGRFLQFGLVRVVDVYADPTKPFDVFFDKTQIINVGGLKYNIDNGRYFDQVDPDSRDGQIVIAKPLENTVWNEITFETIATKYKFKKPNENLGFENILTTGESQFGQYEQISKLLTRVSFANSQDAIFLLQIANQDNSKLLVSVEKKNGNLIPVKKFRLSI